jgi:predicted transcriptional regulator
MYERIPGSSKSNVIMPVQTRTGGQPRASKVYTSTPAAPKQQHFPPRRRHVKTYGRARPKPKNQGTLTQMDFVSSAAQEAVELSSDEDEDDEEEAEPEVAVPAKSAKKSSRANRRKTTGDGEDDNVHQQARDKKRRKTLGDTPSLSSSFHTQTLTQLLGSKVQMEDDWKINDSEDEEDLGLIKETPKKANKFQGSQTAQSLDIGHMPPPPLTLTPSNRRTRTEIPSSLDSPATPLLLRYSPAKQASPLKDKSTNDSAPLSAMKKTQKTPRTQVIPDSYSTSHSSPATPTPKANAHMTPVKKLRFELPEDKENITPGRTKPKSPKTIFERASNRKPLSEVPDSDEDFEETDIEEDDREETSVLEPEQITETRADEEDIIIPEDENVTEAHYAIGDETQAILVSSGNPSSHDLGAINSSGTVPDQNVHSHDEEPEEATSTTKRVHGEFDMVEVVEQTPISSPRHQQPADEAAATQTDDHMQGYTQGLESQRVPLEAIRATGPVSDRSDIIISIYGEHVKKMVDRAKNHEFRGWKIPESVHRVWIYITKPSSELRYMCIFGPHKTAGEIDEDGIGNADFNQGKKLSSKYAYEVLQMYELNNPVPLDLMRKKGWPTAPQKFAYVPPAIVGQLTSNLRCALWGDEAEDGHIQSSPNFTESQELAQQIRSDIVHATQQGSSQHMEVVPSSQSPPKSSRERTTPKNNVFARPALPNAPSASSARSLPTAPSQRSGGLVRPSQATTMSQVSSSSQTHSPDRSVPLPPTRALPAQVSEGSSPTSCRHRQQSSLRSSQFPTRSQMLPDSLLNDDIQEPPPIIWDSADDESE